MNRSMPKVRKIALVMAALVIFATPARADAPGTKFFNALITAICKYAPPGGIIAKLLHCQVGPPAPPPPPPPAP
jgi:hypothetical protein